MFYNTLLSRYGKIFYNEGALIYNIERYSILTTSSILAPFEYTRRVTRRADGYTG